MEESVRQLYDKLLKARQVQVKLVTDTGMKNRVCGFIVTPGMVLLFNYVHRLVGQFRSGMPADPCVEEGGICCSNVSQRKDRPSVRATNANAAAAGHDSNGGHDYVTDRIVYLLEKSIFTDDYQNMTVNVRDEFAANIRTLSLLFEERYRLCQEQSGRLKDELNTVRQQLAARRTLAASSDTTAQTSNDRVVKDLRERITRYEARLNVARAQVDSLLATNERSIDGIKRDVEELIKRVGRSGGVRHANDDTLLDLLRKLIESQEQERGELSSAVRTMELVHRRRKGERSVNDKHEHRPSTDEFDRLVRIATADRVKKSLADRYQEVEDYVNGQVDTRTSRIEQILRAELEIEFATRRLEEQRRFEEAINNEASRVLGGDAVSTVTLKPHDSNLGRIKRILDDAFTFTDSTNPVATFDVHHRSRVHDLLSGYDSKYDAMYTQVDRMLKATNDAYNVLIEQSTGIRSINTVAAEDYVPLEFLPKELVDQAVLRLKQSVGVHTNGSPSDEDTGIGYIDRTVAGLTAWKSTIDEYFRLVRLAIRVESNRRFVEPPTLNDLRIDEREFLSNYESRIGNALTDEERRDLESVRNEVGKYDAEIDRLRESHRANGTGDFSRTNEDALVDRSAMNAAVVLERSKRNELVVNYRKSYNALAAFVNSFGAAFKRSFREISSDLYPPPVLRTHVTTLNRLFDNADRTINFGYTPRPDRDLGDIVPTLEYFFCDSYENLRSDKRTSAESNVRVPPTTMKSAEPSVTSSSASSSPSSTVSVIHVSNATNHRRRDRWTESTNDSRV